MITGNLLSVGSFGLCRGVYVCVRCRSYTIPHFYYRYGFSRWIDLLFTEATALDSYDNLKLKHRRRLDEYLNAARVGGETNWRRLIRMWNENNECQLPEKLHKPCYMDFRPCKDFARFECGTTLREGAMIIVYLEDSETAAHFHYVRTDGSDVAISLTEPLYLSPEGRCLSESELEKLISDLTSVCEGGWIRFEELVELWNSQLAEGSKGKYVRLPDDTTMPDYSRLNTD